MLWLLLNVDFNHIEVKCKLIHGSLWDHQQFHNEKNVLMLINTMNFNFPCKHDQTLLNRNEHIKNILHQSYWNQPQKLTFSAFEWKAAAISSLVILSSEVIVNCFHTRFSFGSVSPDDLEVHLRDWHKTTVACSNCLP